MSEIKMNVKIPITVSSGELINSLASALEIEYLLDDIEVAENDGKIVFKKKSDEDTPESWRNLPEEDRNVIKALETIIKRFDFFEKE